jgi:hypothetical protein
LYYQAHRNMFWRFLDRQLRHKLVYNLPYLLWIDDCRKLREYSRVWCHRDIFHYDGVNWGQQLIGKLASAFRWQTCEGFFYEVFRASCDKRIDEIQCKSLDNHQVIFRRYKVGVGLDSQLVFLHLCRICSKVSNFKHLLVDELPYL